MKYKVGDIVDLDDVFISQAAHDAWQAIAQAAAVGGVLAGVPPNQIPTEQGLWLASGELEIFVEVPSVARLSMKISPSQWRFK